MENGKTIKGLLDAEPLSDGDFLAVNQPTAANLITQQPGDTRRVTVKQLEDYAVAEVKAGIKTDFGILNSHADMVDGMGRNLLDVLGVSTIPEAAAEIRRRCNNNGEIDSTKTPGFRGIMIGDYIDGLDLSGIAAPANGTAPQAWNDAYKNNRIVVSGFNTYKDSGPTENDKNHILFTFRNIIAKGRMNSGWTNAGGYTASELRVWLEGADGDGSGAFAAALKAALGGDYLYTLSKGHSRKGGYEINNYTVWPPTELEVFGYQTHGDEANYTNTNVQFPIYRMSTVHRVKRHNGTRLYYWESTPSASSSTSFCMVHTSGAAFNGTNADYTGGGVSPAFCVA